VGGIDHANPRQLAVGSLEPVDPVLAIPDRKHPQGSAGKDGCIQVTELRELLDIDGTAHSVG
jgi:hypothetical protein